MKQLVVMFAGVSGVGKTTFLQKLSGKMSFQCLTGGTLIAAAREQSDRDALRLSDISENQALLIDGFRIKRDPSAPVVILDGHVSIATPSGLEDIPTAVFRELGISTMVHLEADPDRIQLNRLSDESRNRPPLDDVALHLHQEHSRAHAGSIAAELEVSFQIVTHEDVAKLGKYLSETHG